MLTMMRPRRGGKIIATPGAEPATTGKPGSTRIVDSTTRLDVDAANLTTSGGGSTLQLDAITLDSGDQSEMTGVTLAWVSSNPSAATVHATSGLVTGVGAGSTTIEVTASKNGGSAVDTSPAVINVSAAAVASVATSVSTVGLTDTGTATFTVQPKDSTGANLAGRTVTVDTNDHAVATASINGYTVTVTGVAAGSCAVTATCETIPSSGVTATVSVASSSHPVEPSGGTLETDHSWANGKTGDGWTVDNSYNAAAFILTTTNPEGTRPYASDSWLSSFRYPPGGTVPISYGGSAPLYTSYVPSTGYDRKYWEFALMIPTGWLGDPTASVNKIFFIEVKGSGGQNNFPIYFNVKCNGTGGAGFQFKTQGCPPNAGGNSSTGDGQFPSNASTICPMVRGVWYIFGLELVLNTFAANPSLGVGDDGVLRIWQGTSPANMTLKYTKTDVCIRGGTASSGYATTANHKLRGMILNPTRGGAAATMTQVQYIHMQRPYMVRY